MNSIRLVALGALIAALGIRAALADVQPPSLGSCEEKRTEALIYAGNQVEALAVAQGCLAYHGYKLSQPSANVLDIASVVHYHYVIAQIFAMLGELDHADTAFMQAENFALAEGLLERGRLVYLGSLNEETRGYILERRGEENAALEHYFASRSPFAYGRIAVIALKTKDDINARLYGRRAAIGGDATGDFVLGSLAEIAGDTAIAWNYYHLAQQAMQMRLAQNPSPVLFYAELPRINEALARVPAAVTQPQIVERDGKKTFIDSAGAVVGRERWPGALVLESVRAKQAAYNDWIASKNNGTSYPNIALAPQYPRHFIPSNLDDNVFGNEIILRDIQIPIPVRIEPTGVLDLDTLAIGYYKAALEWSALCKAAGVTSQELIVALPAQSLEQRGQAALRPALIWQLGRAYVALERLRYFLSGVVMHTAAGDTYDAVTESQRYTANMKVLKAGGSRAMGNGADFSTALLDAPPDFMTAHIEPQQLTPALIDELTTRERAVRAELFLAQAMISAQTHTVDAATKQ